MGVMTNPPGTDASAADYRHLVTSLFIDGAAKVTVPWPDAPRLKAFPKGYDPLFVSEHFSGIELSPIDPATLHATQPWIVRQHVEYYLSGEYERTGVTSADRDQPINWRPVIYQRQDGRRLIVSGHHRSTAALLMGRLVWARLVHEDASALPGHG